MKRRLFTLAVLAVVLAITTVVVACGSDAPSREVAEEAIREYLPKARSLLTGRNPYEDVVKVEVLKVGTPFEVEMLGIRSKGWPVKARLTKADGSTREDEFIVFRDSYGDWSAT